MTAPKLFLLLVLGILPLPAWTAEPPKKERPRLITTGLNGREVGFVREMGEADVLLREIARAAKKEVKETQVADFAGSILTSLEEERANLFLLATVQSIALPDDPSAAQREYLKTLKVDGLSAGEFLAEVIKIRSGQLRSIQQVQSSESQPIRDFAGAMVKTIQDELIFIQLLSSKGQKSAPE